MLWHGFFLYLGVMKNNSQYQQESKKESGIAFFCENCTLIGKVFVECWTNKSNGPFKIELLQHEDLIAFKVDEIRINKKPKGKIIRFPFCGHCGFLINQPFDSDYINLINQFNPAQPKN